MYIYSNNNFTKFYNYFIILIKLKIMIFLRLIFLILFLIIGILFTVGYNFFSIINVKNKLYNAEIYINKIKHIDRSTNETSFKNYNELNIDNNYKNILNYLYYGCIITSCLIGVGIIFSYLRMKFISKILFIVAQTFMSTFIGLIVFMYYSSSFIEQLLPFPENIQGFQIPEEYKKFSTSYGDGGLLLIISTVVMMLVYILYSFIG
jgi:hypothetical protein